MIKKNKFGIVIIYLILIITVFSYVQAEDDFTIEEMMKMKKLKDQKDKSELEDLVQKAKNEADNYNFSKAEDYLEEAKENIVDKEDKEKVKKAKDYVVKKEEKYVKKQEKKRNSVSYSYKIIGNIYDFESNGWSHSTLNFYKDGSNYKSVVLAINNDTDDELAPNYWIRVDIDNYSYYINTDSVSKFNGQILKRHGVNSLRQAVNLCIEYFIQNKLK